MERVIHVTIPVHNRLEYTRRCLAALKASKLPGRLAVLVVDDGSTDGTRAALKAEHPDVTVLRGDGTLWWTGAMARAVELLKPGFRPGDFLMSLNNDTEVEAETVSTLMEVSLAHDGAMVAAAAKKEDGSYVATGARLWFGRELGCSIGTDRTDGKGRFQIVEADVIFGRATLIPVAVFDYIGTYSAKEFPQYWGDSDLSLRARRAGVMQLVTFATTVRCAEDVRTTGLHHAESPIVPVGQALRMLLSRRSNLGLVYGWRFMRRHAPEGRNLQAAVRQCVSSCMFVFRRTRAGAIVFWQVRLVYRVVRALRRLLNRFLPYQLLTYPEMRRLGFDPSTLVRERIVVRGRIRHAYWVVEPFHRMWQAHPEYRRLLLHSKNPFNRVRKARWFRRAMRRQGCKSSTGARRV